MKFRTEYQAVRSALTLDPKRPIVLVGSCFASNIALKMKECRWDAFNGVGTLYNPMSIAKVLDLILFGDASDDILYTSLFEAEGMVHSWLFDSHFSSTSKEKCIESILESRTGFLKALKDSQALIVTFGTSWCYSLSEEYKVHSNLEDKLSEYIVANCHKMPASMFSRRRVSVEEIEQLWIDLTLRIKKKFPNITIIFTVSPVRHLKDGFEGNTLSKATLHLAIDKICSNVSYCLYFPAYELLIDDLRDYRFYDSDLEHPSDMAIEYLWDVFCRTYIDEKGLQLLKEGKKKYKRLNHRTIICK